MNYRNVMVPAVLAFCLFLGTSGAAQAENYAYEKAQILQIEQNMAVIPTAAEALKYFDTNI